MVRVAPNLTLLREFEAQLNPRHPERNRIPTRVLGYGEMSTTLQIGRGDDTHLAYKRIPMFENEAEAHHYSEVYRQYVRVLQEEIGIRVVASDIICMPDEAHDRFVVYVVQEKLPAEIIGNQIIRRATTEEAEKVVLAMLQVMAGAFRFNKEQKGEMAVGFDGQISNWAVFNFDPGRPGWEEALELIYFDTSSPLLRVAGEEQLSPELYLRSAPSFLAWILRLLFLEDVVERYYDFRLVIIDLLANLFKEGRPDLVPSLVLTANVFLDDEMEGKFQPIRASEVRGYYRQDAWIWRLYLGFRRIDRELHRLQGKYYPYVLPGPVKR